MHTCALGGVCVCGGGGGGEGCFGEKNGINVGRLSRKCEPMWEVKVHVSGKKRFTWALVKRGSHASISNPRLPSG